MQRIVETVFQLPLFPVEPPGEGEHQGEQGHQRHDEPQSLPFLLQRQQLAVVAVLQVHHLHVLLADGHRVVDGFPLFVRLQRPFVVTFPLQIFAPEQVTVATQRRPAIVRHRVHDDFSLVVASLFDIHHAEQRHRVAQRRGVLGEQCRAIGVTLRLWQRVGEHLVISDVFHDARPLAVVGIFVMRRRPEVDTPSRVVELQVIERVGLVDEHVDHQFRPLRLLRVVQRFLLIVESARVCPAMFVHPSNVLAYLVFLLVVVELWQQYLRLFQLQHGL